MFEIAFSILQYNLLAAMLMIVAFVIEKIILQVKLATMFGKDLGFKFGLVFLPEIFEIILAFGESKYLQNKNEYDFHEVERH